jgi:hypothetical protein
LKRIIVPIFFVLFFGVASAQMLTTGWHRAYIKDVGSIDLPPTMEVQRGEYKEINDKIYKSSAMNIPQFVAQQKGLNEHKRPTGRYARVLLETDIGKHGDYEKLSSNIRYSKSYIAELNKIFKQGTQQKLSESARKLSEGVQQLSGGVRLKIGHQKLIEWRPLKIETINGMSCIHISYTRQLENNPLVIVHEYIFQNNDRMHRLIMSYRQSESDYWENDFSHMLTSFRITNIRH